MAFMRRLSSSGDQLPFIKWSDVILANHRFLQSFLVLLGTCCAIACHLEGFGAPGSSTRGKFMDKLLTLELTFGYGLTQQEVLFRIPFSSWARHVVRRSSAYL